MNNYPDNPIDMYGQTEHVKLQTAHKNTGKLEYTDFRDISACLISNDFVENLLCMNTISVFFGPSKSGKTLFVSDLALHVAFGWPWHGREVEKGCILYFCLEGQQTVMNRIAAFKKHHGISEDCSFRLFKGPVNLLQNANDAEAICEAAAQMAADYNLPVRMIIIDTWSRANPGGKEDTEDTGFAFSHVDYIKDRTEANVCLVHHTPKDGDDPRGSVIMQANPDILIKVFKDKTTKIGTAKIHLQRDGEGEDQFSFTFEKVVLGKNQRGKDVESCVVLPIENIKISGRSILSGQAKIAYDVLTDLMSDVGETKVPKKDMKPQKVVPIKQFREHLKKADLADTDNEGSINTAIKRALAKLKKLNVIKVWGDYVWILEQR